MMHITVLTRLSNCSGNGTTRQFPSDLQLIVHEQLFSVIVLLHDIGHHIAWGKVRAQVFTWLTGEQSHGHIIHEKGFSPLVVAPVCHAQSDMKTTTCTMAKSIVNAVILLYKMYTFLKFRVRVGVRITVRQCVQCLPLFSLS